MARVKREDGTPVSQLIYNAALELFAVYGYEGTTTRQIAAKAGVSAGQVTFHYKTKEALFNTILHDIVRYTSDYFGPLGDEVADKKRRGKLTPNESLKYMDIIIDAQIRYVMDPNNFNRLMMIFVQRKENPQEHAELVNAIVKVIESLFADLLITASKNKMDLITARTVSRAVNGAIISFGEHPEFLIADVDSPSQTIQIEHHLRSIARAMVHSAIESSKA